VSTLHDQLATLYRGRVHLSLETVDICFLAALRDRLQRRGATSLDEEQLRELYELVSEIVEPEAENIQKRATHTFQKLRDQRFLARLDVPGRFDVDYVPTRLALALVEFFSEDEGLTRRSLVVLTTTLHAQLAEILQSARQAQSDEDWTQRVVTPLRVAVSDLLGGIDRRQRGLDLQQEQLRGAIGAALDERWDQALDQCEEMLDEMTRTLSELNQVLMEDCAKLSGLLMDTLQVAAGAGRADVEAELHRVNGQIERVSDWGQDRLEVWSDYFQYVHRYIRTIVRLDPYRAVSHRLQEALRGWAERPWHLMVPDLEPYRHLREVESISARPRIRRPSRDREPPLPDVAPAATLDLDQLVADALAASGAARLLTLLQRELPRVPRRSRFALVGRLVEALGRAGVVIYPRDEAWRIADERIEIQDWLVRPRSDG